MPPPRQNTDITKICRDLFRRVKSKLRNQSAMTDCLNIHSLSWERVNKNFSFIPTPSPSLIREGDIITSLFTSHSSLKQKIAFTLAEGATHVAHFVDVRRVAFTLAEVLITLGIIGIVAAMTMPSLITNYQKQRAVTQLKKSYTNLAEAVKRSELENDTVANWNFDLPAEEFYNTYLSGFLSVNNSTVAKSNIEYKFLNRNTCTARFCTESSYIAYLADGSSIMISFHTGLHTGRVVSIDINGNKRPNTIGKDLFQFAITKDNGVVPFGYGDFGVTNPDGTKYQNFGNYDRDKITGTDSYACNKDKYGVWCSALIMMDGWTMSKDYPW